MNLDCLHTGLLPVSLFDLADPLYPLPDSLGGPLDPFLCGLVEIEHPLGVHGGFLDLFFLGQMDHVDPSLHRPADYQGPLLQGLVDIQSHLLQDHCLGYLVCLLNSPLRGLLDLQVPPLGGLVDLLVVPLHGLVDLQVLTLGGLVDHQVQPYGGLVDLQVLPLAGLVDLSFQPFGGLVDL